MEEPEEWRPVVGFEGLYSVSDQGRVRSEPRLVERPQSDYMTKAKIMKPTSMPRIPYQQLVLTRNPDDKPHAYVHTLVLEAFIGPRPVGMDACHGDGNPTNNHVHNLRWGTRKENHADKKTHGTQTCGESHPCAVLTDDLVRTLRRRVAEGAKPSCLGKEFNLDTNTAHRAATGRSWKHIK